MNSIEFNIYNILKSIPYDVDYIEPKATKTPEFILKDLNSDITIEVKSRFHSLLDIESLREKGFFTKSENSNQISWVFTVAKKAKRQFKSIDSERNLFWVVWLTNETHLLKHEQMVHTIYGVSSVLDHTPTNKEYKYLLNYRSGLFDKYPELSAVIISDSGNFSLCENKNNNHYKLFRQTKLYHFFKFSGGVINPFILKKYHGYLDLPKGIGIKNNEMVLAYLKKKYYYQNPKIFDWNHFTGIII